MVGDLALGPEWAALEVLAVRSGADPQFAELLGGDLDWGELLEQAVRHELLPAVANAALEPPVIEHVPGRVAALLMDALDLNRRRIDLFRAEAVAIGRVLEESGIIYAATKGITLESTLYRSSGARVLKDIDFMIRPQDRDAVLPLMETRGYQQGNFDWRSGLPVPLDRRDHIHRTLNPDHLPRLVRLIDDPVVRFQYVDFANSLTWTNSEYEVPVDEALSEQIRLPLPGTDAEIVVLAPAYQVLFVLLHLFREAWLRQWVELELDVSLSKFAEAHHLLDDLNSRGGMADLQAAIDRHDVGQPIAWVMEHLDRTFSTTWVDTVGVAGVVDEDWLGSANPAGSEERKWHGSMRERLHSKSRETLFA